MKEQTSTSFVCAKLISFGTRRRKPQWPWPTWINVSCCDSCGSSPSLSRSRSLTCEFAGIDLYLLKFGAHTVQAAGGDGPTHRIDAKHSGIKSLRILYFWHDGRERAVISLWTPGAWFTFGGTAGRANCVARRR